MRRCIVGGVVVGIGVLFFWGTLLRVFVLHVYPGLVFYEEKVQLVQTGMAIEAEFGGKVGSQNTKFYADHFSSEGTINDPYSAIGFPIGRVWQIDNWCGVVWVHPERQSTMWQDGRPNFSLQGDYFQATKIAPLKHDNWYYVCFS